MQLGRAKSALYKPDSGPEPHVGIIVMHRESNYLNNVACGVNNVKATPKGQFGLVGSQGAQT